MSQLISGTGLQMTLNSTGTGVNIDTTNTLTSGSAFKVDGTISGAMDAFTGDLLKLNLNRTHNSASITETGNYIDVLRNYTINSANNTWTVTGNLATLTSNCTITSGNCVDTSNLLRLTQNYGRATGAVLNIVNNGIGSAAAILSNSGGQAAFILNKTGDAGDIFTASSSGTTKFTIGLNGEIGLGLSAGLPNFGNSSQCLTSAGTGTTPTWGSCGSGGGSNFWQYDTTTGIVANGNLTTDLLLGGTSTASAKFAVLGIAGTTTPTASVSAQNASAQALVLGGDGSIQSVRNNTLTLGGSTTGDISLMPRNGSGYVGIGTSSPTNILDIQQNVAANVGITLRNANAAANTVINFANDQGATPRTILNQLAGTGGFQVQIVNSEPFIVLTGNTEGLRVTGTGYLGVGTTSPRSELHVTRALSVGVTGKALAIFDQIENQDIFTASKSGVTKFTVSGGGTTPVASISAQTSNSALIVDNSGVGDIFTASSSGLTRFTVKQNGQVVIGSSTNGIVFDYLNGGPTYAGTARPTKTITLSPEFAGSILTASGSANTNVSMTSDASPSANFRTYYELTSTSNPIQDYTVAVRVTLPSDFSDWATGNTMTIAYQNASSASTANKVDAYIYLTSDSSGNPVYFSTANVSTTWTSINLTKGQLNNSHSTDWGTAAGQTAIIYLKMYASGTVNYTHLGDIVLNYLAKF
jgi:hypothetical protein